MGWLLRGILIVVLGILFLKVTLGLLGVLLPFALMALAAVVLWMVLKHLIGGRGSAGAGGCSLDAEMAPKPVSRLDRINARIERLETVLMERNK